MKKNKAKEEVLANGKVIVIDFSKLNPADFSSVIAYTKEELENEIITCSYDGKFYLNSRDGDMADLLKDLFGDLIAQTRYKLESMRKVYRARYPQVKDFVDLHGMENEQKYEALEMLLIPLELKRREIERAYYLTRR